MPIGFEAASWFPARLELDPRALGDWIRTQGRDTPIRNSRLRERPTESLDRVGRTGLDRVMDQSIDLKLSKVRLQDLKSH